jgi:hypothetical protein
MRMRKSKKGWAEVVVLWVLSISMGAIICSAQTIIQNPDKPLAKNAGRVVALKEVMKIADEGDQYFFKSPFNLKIAPDQSIFVQEQEHLWQFDRNGKFVRDYFKKGQGPGEMNYVSNFQLDERNLIIHASGPPKIIWYDYSGRLVDEFTIRQKARVSKFLLFYNPTYYFVGFDFPVVKGEPKAVDMPENILALTQDAEEVKNLISFPTKAFVIPGSGGGGGLFPLSSLITVPYQKKYLFVMHTQEYLVKLYNVENSQVIRAFKRGYERIKDLGLTEEQKKGGVIIDGKHYTRPPQKFSNDIANLFIGGDNLWVVTSTSVKNKGVLIDVFNSGGKYIDNFYLKTPEGSALKLGRPGHVTVLGDFLYGIEETSEGTFVIKKYRIGE